LKPAPFTYLCPSSIEEALTELAEYGEDAKVLGGGQSLVPLLNFRIARPVVLIDINGLAGELDYIRLEEEGTLAVGALTRQRALELTPLTLSRHRTLAEAVPWIGEVGIRNRGTVGGSVAHCDPTAELSTVLIALGGEVVVRGPSGLRHERAVDFFVGSYGTTLADEEIVTEVRFPPEPVGGGTAFIELGRRRGDFALVGVAACLFLGSQGTVVEARLAVAGAGEVPRRMECAENILCGERMSEGVLHEVAELVAEVAEPVGNLHGGEAYRRNLVCVFTARALKLAWKRAINGADGEAIHG